MDVLVACTVFIAGEVKFGWSGAKVTFLAFVHASTAMQHLTINIKLASKLTGMNHYRCEWN